MAGSTAATRTVERVRVLTAAVLPGPRRDSTRHPLVAAAMAVPVALLLAVACGGWHAMAVQASSVAGLMGR
ncbi:hypothetical protein POF50_022745 [Streptomyces sp. SL13]|jgi:hypothetical protein|uniref:Uncharacterized protein n=1 Tax=Streptantibioticus silvisoli TaxID=2705255 RepID=A0AA90H7U7_9ACTN|nr:hypothetical protein [Streptantibioticus silvisoli]MDI5964649.1 hypothetical protein [Streptantibioticus silvisoli]MDI5972122.1 hypothetical protein [Streptantibioticus silvisoli]